MTEARTPGPCVRCGNRRTIAVGVCHAPPGTLLRCEACGHAWLDAPAPTMVHGLCKKCGSPRIRNVGRTDASSLVSYFRCDECEFLAIVRQTKH